MSQSPDSASRRAPLPPAVTSLRAPAAAPPANLEPPPPFVGGPASGTMRPRLRGGAAFASTMPLHAERDAEQARPETREDVPETRPEELETTEGWADTTIDVGDTSEGFPEQGDDAVYAPPAEPLQDALETRWPEPPPEWEVAFTETEESAALHAEPAGADALWQPEPLDADIGTTAFGAREFDAPEYAEEPGGADIGADESGPIAYETIEVEYGAFEAEYGAVDAERGAIDRQYHAEPPEAQTTEFAADATDTADTALPWEVERVTASEYTSEDAPEQPDWPMPHVQASASAPWGDDEPVVETPSFPLDAFIVPDHTRRVPSGYEEDRNALLAQRLAVRLEELAQRLRTQGLGSLADSDVADDLSRVVAAVVAGYVTRDSR